MNRFEKVITEHLKTVPQKYTQAVDGITCELYLRGHSFSFLRWRLDRMVKKGLIRRGNPMRSIFSSYDGTPTYGQVFTQETTK